MHSPRQQMDKSRARRSISRRHRTSRPLVPDCRQSRTGSALQNCHQIFRRIGLPATRRRREQPARAALPCTTHACPTAKTLQHPSQASSTATGAPGAQVGIQRPEQTRSSIIRSRKGSVWRVSLTPSGTRGSGHSGGRQSSLNFRTQGHISRAPERLESADNSRGGEGEDFGSTGVSRYGALMRPHAALSALIDNLHLKPNERLISKALGFNLPEYWSSWVMEGAVHRQEPHSLRASRFAGASGIRDRGR